MYTYVLSHFGLFALAFTRIGCMVFSAPIFGSRTIPVKLRIAISLALTLFVTSVQPTIPTMVPELWPLAIAREAIVGLSFGMGIAVLFGTMQICGQLIGQTSGLGYAQLIDTGSGKSTPILGQALELLAIVVFLSIGGHRQLLAGLLESFQAIPCLTNNDIATATAETQTLLNDAFNLILLMLTQSWTLAIRMALPIVVTALIANIVVAIIGRSLPQLNLFSIGMSLNVAVLIAVISISVGTIALLFQEQVDETFATILSELTNHI